MPFYACLAGSPAGTDLGYAARQARLARRARRRDGVATSLAGHRIDVLDRPDYIDAASPIHRTTGFHYNCKPYIDDGLTLKKDGVSRSVCQSPEIFAIYNIYKGLKLGLPGGSCFFPKGNYELQTWALKSCSKVGEPALHNDSNKNIQLYPSTLIKKTGSRPVEGAFSSSSWDGHCHWH